MKIKFSFFSVSTNCLNSNLEENTSILSCTFAQNSFVNIIRSNFLRDFRSVRDFSPLENEGHDSKLINVYRIVCLIRNENNYLAYIFHFHTYLILITVLLGAVCTRTACLSSHSWVTCLRRLDLEADTRYIPQ